MNHICQKYLDNLTAAHGLLKPHLETNMTEEQGLGEIRECAEGLFRIHQENDRILDEILFSRKAETLTAREAGELSELADALFRYNRSPDTGIAYRIHELLYAYAQYQGDTELLIRELYCQGITLFYLNVNDSLQGNGLFADKIGEHFRAGASYLKQYEEFQNPQTRMYILRCLGNVKYGLKSTEGDRDWAAYMECFQRAMEIFQSPYYRQLNPEIPWDNFCYTMHYDRTTYLSVLRDRPDPEMARHVLESAEYVWRHQEQIAKSNDTSIGVRTKYVYAAARFHAGLLSPQELMETLFRICESADLQDFSGDNIWALLNTPEYLIRYAKELSGEEQLELRPRLERALDKQKEYLFLLPRNEYVIQVSRTIQNIAGYLSKQDTSFSRRLLDYILACHPPTYVHSKMVALLTRRLCGEMAGRRPELLAGTFGFETADSASGNLDKILEAAYEGGLYHDLGKCMLLSYVGLYSRKLLDEEFACIKQHPAYGNELLKSLKLEDMSKIAYYHHRTFDGFGGYPGTDEECSARVRRIADIVTVVDALDAGTDNVGRSYAASKTYEQLVEELRAWKGKRYAPEVVELFDDSDFYASTKQFLTDSRRQVYLDIYCNSSALG